jgi:predicted metalloprotease
MSFNEGVSIDTSHASRGGGGGRGPVMIGGGIGTIVIVIIAMLLGVDPGAILGGSPQQDAGQLQDAGDLATECRTGADANNNVDCRILATENSLDTYWSAAAPQYGFSYAR